MVFLDTAGSLAALPPYTWSTTFTHWWIDPYLTVLTVWGVGFYLFGVWVLRQRGDRWPLGRTLCFTVGGWGSVFFATSSGLGAYDTTLLSVHMVQHMILSMAAPVFLALGAPVTLMLRTFPTRPRRWLLAVLHSRVAKVLTFPPLAFAAFVVSPWALYMTGWYPATLRSEYLHEMTHMHLVLVGCLFMWPMVGLDPIPGRIAYPFRLLLMVLTLPFHAFLGVTIMGQETLIGGEWYRSLHRVAGMGWLPSPISDQHLAGGILWGSGDLVGILFAAALFAQWVRYSLREAAREDRRLDRLEAAASSTDPPR